MTTGPAPLFRLARASLVCADGSLVGPLDAEVGGEVERLGLVGDWSACFRLLEGRARLSQGSAEVVGVPLERALARGVVGLLPLDPPLPERLTALGYLTESARLLGRGRAFASERARAALSAFEVEHLARRPLGALGTAERRVLGIANAVLGEPPLLCFEAPLDRLDDAPAAYVEKALERARAGRLSIVSAFALEALGRERALLERSARLLLLKRGELRSSTPSELEQPANSQLLLTVSANAEAFAERLRALGLSPTPLGHVDALFALVAPSEGASIERFAVAQADTESKARIIEAALDAGAPLLEMRPLTPAELGRQPRY